MQLPPRRRRRRRRRRQQRPLERIVVNVATAARTPAIRRLRRRCSRRRRRAARSYTRRPPAITPRRRPKRPTTRARGVWCAAFVSGIIGSSGNLIVVPYMSRFRSAYTSAYFAGTGLSGIFASALAAAQVWGASDASPNFGPD
ncbi:hypothetical protein N9M16_00515, partial [Candidatus Dependentiae bacterium]|nr:hypothetical protein [Candidatus Dependentiae bacterium]